VQECFESTRRRIEQLVDNLHKQLLHMLIQKHPDHATTTAAAVDDDDGDDGNDGEDAGVKSQLKHFDDAVFSLLRQLAAQRDFSPCVEVARLFTILQLFKLFNLVVLATGATILPVVM